MERFSASICRQNEDEITVFDSSGISLQDLYMAKAILDATRRS
ncbi:Ornithine cyclodeaminase (plasmid) [Sinorhizobium sojae CCBAU 05684]|uniref:Ornithine cyclodeaminase n=1 Tax=Sinorhizobium sojae CCBAU 05684 TaxID=716928 RepID=A0A249PHP2_9HYPH|nr:Ornithine cyclodeaminase [Sinorhizobium sojae CCBAU 05684]